MTAMAAQAALCKRGLAALIVPADVSSATAPDEPHFAHPVLEADAGPPDVKFLRCALVISRASCGRWSSLGPDHQGRGIGDCDDAILDLRR
jgi:hypothetical protein